MIYVSILGGMGNQLFTFAFARALQARQSDNLSLGMGLAGREFALDKLSIDFSDVEIPSDPDTVRHRHPIRFGLTWFLHASVNFVGEHISLRLKAGLERLMQPLLNWLGFFVATDGYFPTADKWLTRNANTWGYFQSEKYFLPVREQVRREFRVSTPLNETNAATLAQIKASNSVCLHVRRSDYTTSGSDLLVCTPSYYLRAVQLMRERTDSPCFFVFSDDVAWTMENVPLQDAIYVDHNNPAHEDFRLMYSCRHFIISNSSFSWWAQYLGDAHEKVVIAPNIWFNSKKQCDISQDSWIQIAP